MFYLLATKPALAGQTAVDVAKPFDISWEQADLTVSLLLHTYFSKAHPLLGFQPLLALLPQQSTFSSYLGGALGQSGYIALCMIQTFSINLLFIFGFAHDICHNENLCS